MDNETINICEHIYESRVRKVLERYNKYISMGKYDSGTLEQEEHYIFCNKCGDIKKVELSTNPPLQ